MKLALYVCLKDVSFLYFFCFKMNVPQESDTSKMIADFVQNSKTCLPLDQRQGKICSRNTFMIKRTINEEIIILLLQQVKIGD